MADSLLLIFNVKKPCTSADNTQGNKLCISIDTNNNINKVMTPLKLELRV